MSDDENHHPRLLMLHHAEGEIEGRAKYQKLLFNYANEEADETDITFLSEDFGPFDPGLTMAMRRYQDIGLVEVDDDEEPYSVIQTEKGQRFIRGFQRTKSRLDDTFTDTVSRIRRIVEKHGDKSASEMVKRENVQEAKEEPFRKEL